MRKFTCARRALPVALAGALAGCGGSDGGGGASEGSLSLSVTDAPVDSAQSVTVEFTGVEIRPSSGEPMVFDFDEPRTIDLLDLQGDASESLLDDEPVPAGEYNQIRLMVNAEFNDELDSFIELDDGRMFELRVPSGSQSGLKLNQGFTVAADGESDFTIDFDLRKAVVNPPGQSGYFLRPSLRLVNNLEVGHIAGTVANTLLDGSNGMCSDMDPETGNAVYVFEGEVTPDDMDGVEDTPEPVTTALVEMDDEGTFEYMAGFLTPGDYTVAFTCQAGLDNVPNPEGGDAQAQADDDIAFQPSAGMSVSVEADETATVNFTE